MAIQVYQVHTVQKAKVSLALWFVSLVFYTYLYSKTSGSFSSQHCLYIPFRVHQVYQAYQVSLV